MKEQLEPEEINRLVRTSSLFGRKSKIQDRLTYDSSSRIPARRRLPKIKGKAAVKQAKRLRRVLRDRAIFKSLTDSEEFPYRD